MIQFKGYLVYYVKKNGKTGVYHSKYSLCIDGAEEAARLDVKGIAEITQVVKVA